MSLANAFLAVELHLYFLTRAQFCNKDVSVESLRSVFALKSRSLISKRDPLKFTSVNICVVVKLVLINSIIDNHRCGWVLLSASYMKLELNAVFFGVKSREVNWFSGI
jgi:hypothetical protein